MSQPNDSALIVRPLTSDDVAALVALANEPSVIEGTAPFVTLYGDEVFADWITRDGCMMGAFHSDALLGVLLAEPSPSILRPHVLDIGFIAVVPTARGLGVGDALLGETLAWARARGRTRIELRVWPENKAAIRLYERHGFLTEGRLREHALVDGQLRDALTMARIEPPHT